MLPCWTFWPGTTTMFAPSTTEQRRHPTFQETPMSPLDFTPAVGVRIRHYPVKPEEVLAALVEQQTSTRSTA